MHASYLLSTLLELLVKSTAILAAAAGLNWPLRRVSAARRHVLWLATYAILLLLPASRCLAPMWPLRLERNPLPPIVTAARSVSFANRPDVTTAAGQNTPFPDPGRLPGRDEMLLWVWLLGAAGLSGHRWVGSRKLARLRRDSSVAADPRLASLIRAAVIELGWSKRRVEVRLSPRVPVPVTWGIWRPVVLLPSAAAAGWTDIQLLAACRHELGHVARHDYLTRSLAHIASAFYWPNPLVWLAGRALRTVQEEACDDLVLRAGTPAPDYAALLLDAARRLHDARPAEKAVFAVAMARPSTLRRRVLAIVDETRDRRPAGNVAWLLGLAVTALVFGTSALAQVAADRPRAARRPTLVSKTQIEVSTKFIEAPAAAFPDVPRRRLPEGSPPGGSKPLLFHTPVILSPAQLQEKVRELNQTKGMDLLSAPRVTTNPGQQATVEIIGKLTVHGVEKSVGHSCTIEPSLADGKIKLKVTAKWTDLAKDPASNEETGEVQERSIQTELSLNSGETAILPAAAPLRGENEAALFVWVGAKIIDATVVAKAAEILVPHLELHDATLPASLDYLHKISVEYDPEKRGVNFKLGRREDESIDPRITIELNDMALWDAAWYVAHLGGVNVDHTSDTIVFAGRAQSRNESTPDSPALAKANSLIIPWVSFQEARVIEVLASLRQTARELDPEKSGVNLVFNAGRAAGEAKITLAIKQAPMSEVLRAVARSGGLELVADPDVLVFYPPRVDEPSSREPQ